MDVGGRVRTGQGWWKVLSVSRYRAPQGIERECLPGATGTVGARPYLCLKYRS